MSDLSNLYLPKAFLSANINRKICVKLKWGPEYIGILESVDDFMNVCLLGTEEYIAGEKKGVIGDMIVRCNNILYMRELDEESQ